MSKLWNSDTELFEIVRNELYSAVVGDCMDKMGLLTQFLPPRIKAIQKEMSVVGRAMTVLQADVIDTGSGKHNELLKQPFGLMLEALDDLKQDEVYICAGSNPGYALWGELMSTRAMTLGAAGAVVSGYMRDYHGIVKLGFPTFAFGAYAKDQGPRGKVLDWRVPIVIGEVRIEPGDIVIGDVDGVCIVPRLHEEEIMTAAIEKSRGEKMVQEKIKNGMSAREAFDRYGIL